MEKDLVRKEVWLWEDKVAPLQREADKKEWSLKKYMEWVLIKQSERLSNKQSTKSKINSSK